VLRSGAVCSWSPSADMGTPSRCDGRRRCALIVEQGHRLPWGFTVLDRHFVASSQERTLPSSEMKHEKGDRMQANGRWERNGHGSERRCG